MMIGAIGFVAPYSFFLILTYLELKYIREDEEKRNEMIEGPKILRKDMLKFTLCSLLLLGVIFIPISHLNISTNTDILLGIIKMLLGILSAVFMGIALYKLSWLYKIKKSHLTIDSSESRSEIDG